MTSRFLDAAQIRDLIQAELTTLWQPPGHLERQDQADLYLAVLWDTVGALRPDLATLREAWRRVCATWRVRHWPTPAAICEAIREVHQRRPQPESYPALPPPVDEDPRGTAADQAAYWQAVRRAQELAASTDPGERRLGAALLSCHEGIEKQCRRYERTGRRHAA